MSPAPLADNASASQIKTADMCMRKWWFDKVAGVRERQKHHFHLGHALHAVGERFLLGLFATEQDLYIPGWDEGLEDFEKEWMRTVVRRAIATGIWSALPNAYIEFPILYLMGENHRDADGLPLMAASNTYEDKEKVRRHGKPTQLIDGRPLPPDWDRLPLFVGFIDVMQLGTSPAIIDHKSAKSRKYTLTPKDLAEDSQVLSYAAAAWQLSGARVPVRLRHNVFLKADVKPEKQVFTTDAVAPLDAIQRQWEHNRATVLKMIQMRQQAPKLVDPDVRNHANKYAKRANNYLKVPSALDQGRVREACDCYGGCPFREACFGRARIETVVQQLDAPDPFGAVIASRDEGRKANQYGPLMFSKYLVTPGTPPMFNAPAPAPKPAATVVLHSDAYVLDPENPKIQYKARVTGFAPGGAYSVKLWPVPEVPPNFDTLPTTYATDLPYTTLSSVPHPGSVVTGYAAGLIAGGFDAAAIFWEPAQGVEAVAAGVGTAKIPKRSEVDNAFGALQGLGVPAGGIKITPPISPTAPAEQGALEHVPAVTNPVAIGAVLRVAQSAHTFWGPRKGKLATVIAISPGDDDTIMYTVEIDGLPYPDVLAGRFELIPVVGGPAGYDPTADLMTRAKSLKGSLVTITVNTTPSPFNVPLDDVTDVGISALSGQVAPTWAQIIDIQPLTQQSIPHLAEPKGPGKVLANLEADAAKGKAKTAKQLEKEAKAAAKQEIAQAKETAKQEIVQAKEAAKKAAADLQALLAEGKAKTLALKAAGATTIAPPNPERDPAKNAMTLANNPIQTTPSVGNGLLQLPVTPAPAAAATQADPLTIASDLLHSILASDRLNRAQVEALLPLIEQAKALNVKPPFGERYTLSEVTKKHLEIMAGLQQLVDMTACGTTA